jgi:hypothetical protein
MAAYYAFMLLLNAVAPFLQSVMYRLFSDPNWWFGLIVRHRTNAVFALVLDIDFCFSVVYCDLIWSIYGYQVHHIQLHTNEISISAVHGIT